MFLELKANSSLINWFQSILVNKTQRMKLNGVLSGTLYTNKFKSRHPQDRSITFSDETFIVSLLCVNDSSATLMRLSMLGFGGMIRTCSETLIKKEIIFDITAVTEHIL